MTARHGSRQPGRDGDRHYKTLFGRGGSSKFERYEQLKADLTASAKNSAEYAAACQRAARLAVV